jgi:hypothetical protein
VSGAGFGRGALALVLGVLAPPVAGCAPAASRPEAAGAPGTSPRPSAVPAGAPDASPHPAPEESATAVVDAALGVVSRARELSVLGSVRGVSETRATMAQQVRATIEKDVPAEVMAAEADLLTALGVAPTDFDYGASIIDLMSSQLAGYYDPASKTMFLASDLGKAEREATLSHELVHALQDQHYHLENLTQYRPDQSDAQSAVHALAEGDATSAMFDQMLASRGMKATDLSEQLIGVQVRAAASFSTGTGKVPDVLKRSLVAPYVDGIEFVHFLRRRGGWAAVDAAWTSPPVSTEQLLHPEKFVAHELPLAVAVPSSPEGAGEPVYTDVMGEQSVRLLLEEWMPRAPAIIASAGWGGDRVGVWRFGGAAPRVAMAWHIVGDDVATATHMHAGLVRGLEAQRDPGAKGKAGPCVERSERGPLLVDRRGRDIVVIAGPFERQGGAARSASSCPAARLWADRVFGPSRPAKSP